MKKLFLLLILALLPIASVLAVTGTATVNGIRYSYNTVTKEATIIQPEPKVIIVGDETFTSSALYGGDIVIPYQVTITVSGTSYTCKVSVGNGVFDDSNDITSVSIDVENVGTWFQNNWGITKVTLGSHVKSIASKAFYNCANMENATIPQNVTTIGASAFANCGNLQTLTFTGSSQLTTISQEAFANTALTKLTLPSTVTSIGTGAFKDCEYLTTLSLPQNLTTIGAQAFQNCVRLSKLTIPSSVKYIRNQAFQGCISITSLVIPDNVTTLGEEAFSGCEELSSITIGSKIQTIGSRAFEKCTALTKVNIPNTVRTIGDYVFADCTNITELNLGSGVRKIGDGAFLNCKGLTQVKLPTYLTTLGSAFQNCTGLTYLEIPQNVTSIANYSFSGCSHLAAISFGAKVTEFGSNVFYGCSELRKIYCSATTPPTADANLFYNFSPTLCTLYVPKSSLSAYQTATAWKNLDTIKEISYLINGVYYYLDDDALTAEVTFPRDTYSGNVIIYSTVTYDGKTYTVKSIGDNAFSGFPGVTSVSIPSTVETIGRWAFQGCSGITSFDLKSVKVIGDMAFCNCSGLTTLTIFYDNNLTTIGAEAFRGCKSLKEVSIPMNVTSIGREAFSGCSGMTRFSHHTNCAFTEIAEETFYGCSSLEIGHFPKTVTTIGKNAFKNCTKMREVDMYEGLKEIGESAFSGCTGLSSVKIPNSVTTIGASAFNGSGLAYVTIGSESKSSLSNVKSKAFANCTKLKEVNCLAKNVNYAASEVFSGSSVASATLYVPFGYTANYQSKTPWSGFGHIMEKTYYANDMYYLLDFDELKASVGIHPKQYKGDLEIPEGVTYGGRDFVVTGIGWRAFADNTELGTVVIPKTVTTIGDEAFANCTGLSYDLYCYGETAPVADGDPASVFSGVDIEKMTLFVKSGCKPKYSPVKPWSFFGKIEELGQEIDGVYYKLDAKKGTAEVVADLSKYTGDVVIPETFTFEGKEYRVTTIGASAFKNCTALTSVSFPASVKTIGNEAFANCTSLTELTLPEGLTSIGQYAFADCTHLTFVYIPQSVTSIGQYAFSNCSSLAKIILPDNLTTINEGTFNQCSSMASVSIGCRVTTIAELAFAHCSGLQEFNSAPVNAPTAAASTFEDTYVQHVTLYVSEGSKPSYDAKAPWSNFDEIVEIKTGDLNDDDLVNDTDLTLLVKVVMGEVAPDDPVWFKADLNKDGKRNAADIVVLLKKKK